jgi:serine/threonine-protein kinase
VLFWALTGEVPFRRDNQEARLWAHLTATPPAPSALVPGLPPALDAVVARALAKEPDDRFPSAGALGRAALEAAGAAVPALARPAGAGGAAGEETLTGDALATPALAATAVGRRPDPADDTRTLAGRERGRHRRRRLLAASVMLAAGSAGAVAASGGAGDEAAAGGRVPAGDARPAARPHDFAGDRRLDLVAAHPGEDGGAPRRIVSPGAGQPQRTPVTASPRSPRWAGTKRAS